MANFKYYAVKMGFVPGVYPTWNEAKRQIQGFRRSAHKGFDDLAEAEAFAGAKLVVDSEVTPFVVIHDGSAVTRVNLTAEVRAALEAAGIAINAQ